MKRFITVLPLLIMMSACGQTTSSGDGPAFSPRSGEWQAALNAKDVDAIAALYRDDARLLPPNGEASIGKDGVRAAFGSMIEAGLSGELTPIETMSGGDIAYNVGTYKLTAGGELVDRGKFIEIWHRGDDGEWLMSNDIWNSDLPVPMPAGGGQMSHLMIMHEVEDAERWLAAWRGEDSRHELFKANGAAHVHTFTNPDKPNQAGLVVAVRDMEALNAMLESEEGLAAAAEDGVVQDSLTVFTEAK